MVSNNIITDHALLKRWITKEGKVDYTGLKNDEELGKLLENIEDTNLSDYTHEEKFAFWLNAYNLLTIKGVLQELSRNPEWQGNLSLLTKIRFFYFRRFKVAGRKINLYNLENRILRKEFNDFRIHFAINCASNSCPVLPGLLFKAETLDSYLEELTESFINNNDHVSHDPSSNTLYLNSIFKWYSKDFLPAGGVKEFIKKYWKKETNSDGIDKANIVYTDYDWQLNNKK